MTGAPVPGAQDGEEGVLRDVLPLFPQHPGVVVPPGDDAAVVRFPSDVVVTTDMLVEDRDFRRSWAGPYDVGWKAAAQNLADVAAMGAFPSALVVALGLPEGLPEQWAAEFARGLRECCAELSPTPCSVVGGDLSRAPVVVVGVTALGYLGAWDPVTRAGAGAGGTLALAGTVGLAAAGLEELEDRVQVGGGFASRQLRPRPPLTSGPEAAAAGATAMLDVSDGLLLDAARIARASGVRVDVSLEDLRRAVPELGGSSLSPREQEGHLLTGGEDHGLLAVFPDAAALPEGFRPIGRVRPATEESPAMVTVDGREHGRGRGGWDHFG